jgi:hypothetical protein
MFVFVLSISLLCLVNNESPSIGGLIIQFKKGHASPLVYLVLYTCGRSQDSVLTNLWFGVFSPGQFSAIDFLFYFWISLEVNKQ